MKNDERRHALWLTKGLGRGGVERLLLDMYPLVDPSRYTVDVAYVLPWKNDYHQPLVEAGASVQCVGGNRGVADPRWLGRLASLVANDHYDIVHTHAPIPAVGARMLTIGRNRPSLVHTEHNMWDRYRLPTRAANSLTYNRNSVAIAVSQTVAETVDPIIPWRRPPVEVVHHGTNLSSVRVFGKSERQRRRAQLGITDDRTVIGVVGNLTPKKDHQTLLRAIAGDGPTARATVVVIGLGPLRGELEALATELGIADRTIFLGSRDDVFDLLPLFDLFCLSSRFEGFPIALIEAMASGLPCVTTAVGGIPEIVEDGYNGLLVAPGAPDELRVALGRVISDPALAASLRSSARTTAEKLELPNVVGHLQELYDRVLSDRPLAGREQNR
ncbi:MAG: glycosyltransferase [Acidimicrobiales bacterium]